MTARRTTRYYHRHDRSPAKSKAVGALIVAGNQPRTSSAEPWQDTISRAYRLGSGAVLDRLQVRRLREDWDGAMHSLGVQ